MINHVADIFERESGDVVHARRKDLLPPGYTCKGWAEEWTKETDILDVWFDSGTSSVAVLENREELRWPADVYIEGGDQFRGWFNSSLMIGIAAHDRAPYKTVITHGWTLDAQGRAMHKSAGNAVEPDKVIKQSGAEIIRLWCASSNYFDDMRGSDEILQRVTDGYRKLRNTRASRSEISTASIRNVTVCRSKRWKRSIVGRWRNWIASQKRCWRRMKLTSFTTSTRLCLTSRR